MAMVTLRLPPEEKADWQARAAALSLTMTEFVRARVNGLEVAAPVAAPPAEPKPAATPKPSRQAQKPSECSRAAFHRPGCFCKTCETTPS